MADLMRWIASLPLSQMIRKSTWLIPFMQTLHILATGMLLASVILIALPIWGYSDAETAIERTRRFLPWLWGGLLLLTVTGIGLVLGTPRTVTDPALQTKMLMMGPAILVTVVIALVLRPGNRTRAAASVLATVSLVLWVGMTFAGRGRWISGFLSLSARLAIRQRSSSVRWLCAGSKPRRSLCSCRNRRGAFRRSR